MAADEKRKALVFLFLALMTTLVLGVGLPRLKFQPGMPVPSLDNGQVLVPPAGDSPPVVVAASALPLIVMTIAAVVFLLITAYRAMKGTSWRNLLAGFLSFLRVLLILFCASLLLIFLLPRSEGPGLPEPLPVPKPIVSMSLGPVPSLLVWLVGIGLVGAAILVGVWMMRSQRQSAREPWEQHAEKARQDLLAGGDLKSVILRCYQEMSQALQQERQIERDACMTTGEFEGLLAAKGVPREPVHQLTQLFEAVRYGHWQPDAGDEQRALNSLDAILENSHQVGQGN